jgi:hypothetical protein
MSNCGFCRCDAFAVLFVDARLPDGSRAHAVLGCISLRVPAQRTSSLRDCVASGSLTPGAAQLLTRMIEAKLAFLISGGTGSGKATFRLRHYWGGRIAADPDGSSMLRNRLRCHAFCMPLGEEHAEGMTDRDDFLAWVKSALYEAELAVHNGDAVPTPGALVPQPAREHPWCIGYSILRQFGPAQFSA